VIVSSDIGKAEPEAKRDPDQCKSGGEIHAKPASSPHEEEYSRKDRGQHKLNQNRTDVRVA